MEYTSINGNSDLEFDSNATITISDEAWREHQREFTKDYNEWQAKTREDSMKQVKSNTDCAWYINSEKLPCTPADSGFTIEDNLLVYQKPYQKPVKASDGFANQYLEVSVILGFAVGLIWFSGLLMPAVVKFIRFLNDDDRPLGDNDWGLVHIAKEIDDEFFWGKMRLMSNGDSMVFLFAVFLLIAAAWLPLGVIGGILGAAYGLRAFVRYMKSRHDHQLTKDQRIIELEGKVRSLERRMDIKDV